MLHLRRVQRLQRLGRPLLIFVRFRFVSREASKAKAKPKPKAKAKVQASCKLRFGTSWKCKQVT